MREVVEVRRGEERRRRAVAVAAEAELAPAASTSPTAAATTARSRYRQGKPMRPDVALAFDRMAAAARADGVTLLITSAFRSDAEQAVLFAATPTRSGSRRPGTSLHRYGTELDLGPPAAYGWLAANAPRFHFIQRYPWEPWHYGYALNPRSSPRPRRGRRRPQGSAVPAFVPDRFAPLLARAAQRWNVSAALLAAQLYAECNFNPFARSPAGAQGIAQFMPGTARGDGPRRPVRRRRRRSTPRRT